jgi:Mn-containing catalase
MFVRSNRLGYTARVSEADPRLAGLLLGRICGAQPALAAPGRTFAQGLAESDGARKDMLLGVAADELGRLELLGAMVCMLDGRGGGVAADGSGQAELLADIAQGGESRTAALLCGAASLAGPAAVWVAPPHLEEVAHAPSALLSGIAAKAQAPRLFRGLMAATDDADLRDALGFLMDCEAAHRAALQAALHAIEPTMSAKAAPADL